MIVAIIIDKKGKDRDFLQNTLIQNFPKKITLVKTCDTVKEGVEAILMYKPELVFLEVQMPNENGFELFTHFENPSFEVIFTTSTRDYAIDAIRYLALDYLLKPVKYIDLISTIKRFEYKKKKSTQKKEAETNYHTLRNYDTNYNKIAFPTNGGYELIKLNSIIYCKSESNYCSIISIDRNGLLVAKTLKFIEELISNDLFFRIHKSYLVNMNYVADFNKTDKFEIRLTNGVKLPVSSRKRAQFLKIILNK